MNYINSVKRSGIVIVLLVSAICAICAFCASAFQYRNETREINAIRFTQAVSCAIYGANYYHPSRHFIFHRSGRY